MAKTIRVSDAVWYTLKQWALWDRSTICEELERLVLANQRTGPAPKSFTEALHQAADTARIAPMSEADQQCADNSLNAARMVHSAPVRELQYEDEK